MARKPAQRVHNEWFRPVSLGGRKSCPNCHTKTADLWSWGEYSNARWYTVMHFCRHCFEEEVTPRLLAHAKPCGCTFVLNIVGLGWHQQCPNWLHIEGMQTY
jgi:hypothetical protein